MSMRAAGLIVPATMPSPASAAASPDIVAAATPRWISTSDGIAMLVEDRLALRRFVQQHVERRNVGVPLEQGRLRPETLDRGAVQRPNRSCDPRPVRADQARPAGVVPGEVDL